MTLLNIISPINRVDCRFYNVMGLSRRLSIDPVGLKYETIGKAWRCFMNMVIENENWLSKRLPYPYVVKV